MKLALAGLLAIAVMFAACSSSGSPAATPTRPPVATTSISPAVGSSVASNTVWLCKPGIANNPCEGDLTATVFHADGSTSIEKAQPAKNPPIDCFYVYPTASGSRRRTRTSGSIRRRSTSPSCRSRASASSAACTRRSSAADGRRPLWPESSRGQPQTRPRGGVPGCRLRMEGLSGARQQRPRLRADWPFAGQLRTDAADSRADRQRRVGPRPARSAIVLGGNVTALNDAAGAGAIATAAASGGASFAHISACTSASQLGCVVAYSSFPSMPPAKAIFGLVRGAAASTSHVLCTDPGSAPRRYGGASRLPSGAGQRAHRIR